MRLLLLATIIGLPQYLHGDEQDFKFVKANDVTGLPTTGDEAKELAHQLALKVPGGFRVYERGAAIHQLPLRYPTHWAYAAPKYEGNGRLWLHIHRSIAKNGERFGLVHNTALARNQRDQVTVTSKLFDEYHAKDDVPWGSKFNKLKKWQHTNGEKYNMSAFEVVKARLIFQSKDSEYEYLGSLKGVSDPISWFPLNFGALGPGQEVTFDIVYSGDRGEFADGLQTRTFHFRTAPVDE